MEYINLVHESSIDLTTTLDEGNRSMYYACINNFTRAGKIIETSIATVAKFPEFSQTQELRLAREKLASINKTLRRLNVGYKFLYGNTKEFFVGKRDLYRVYATEP